MLANSECTDYTLNNPDTLTKYKSAATISQKVLGLPTISLYKGGIKVGEVTKEDASKAGILTMIEAAL